MSKKEKMNEEAVNEEVIEEAAQTTEEVEQAEEMIDDQAVVIAELNKKVEEMEDKYLRAHAEMQNVAMRNRTEREQLQRYRSQDLAKKILPALDNLERAMAIEADDEVSTNLKKGVEMVAENLRQALNEEGVEEIAAIGETFDPILHQAVQTVPADEEHPAETIVEVFQKGYKLHDRVLRASMVVVAQ